MLTQLAVSKPYLTRHKTEEKGHCFASCTGLVLELESPRTGEGFRVACHHFIPLHPHAAKANPSVCSPGTATSSNHIMQSCLEISLTKRKLFQPIYSILEYGSNRK